MYPLVDFDGDSLVMHPLVGSDGVSLVMYRLIGFAWLRTLPTSSRLAFYLASPKRLFTYLPSVFRGSGFLETLGVDSGPAGVPSPFGSRRLSLRADSGASWVAFWLPRASRAG